MANLRFKHNQRQLFVALLATLYSSIRLCVEAIDTSKKQCLLK